MSGAVENNASGWGELRLAEGEAARWTIGPLELTVLRGAQEWQLAWDRHPDRADSQEWDLERGVEMPAAPAKHERHVVGRTGDAVALWPALPDRPVVSLPRLPFHLLPEREVTLYVGSPIWVRLETGDPATTLRDLPSHRPSDTWFGANTREGELCYATETHALLNLEHVPVMRRSAVTPVRIRNRAATPLALQRLKLPVPLLKLYADSRGRLWTEGVDLTRSEESDMASLEVRDGAPREAGETTLMTPAREQPEDNLLTRAFSSLLRFTQSEEDK